MKVLISKKAQNRNIWNGKGDLHTKEGIISEEELNSQKTTLINNKKKEYIKFDAQKQDKIVKYKRGPQIITPKDLGYIISRTYTGKNDIIIEAGGGSGAATCFFANIAKEVHTYEIREDHMPIIEHNLKYMEVDNVTLTCGDLKDHIDNEKKIDLLFLDMPNPLPIIEKDIKGLSSGKYIVCYLPSITQIQELTQLISDNEERYYIEEISEVSIREWKVWGQVSRPMHRKDIDHTAFLVFIRKL